MSHLGTADSGPDPAEHRGVTITHNIPAPTAGSAAARGVASAAPASSGRSPALARAIDAAVALVSPQTALRRAAARTALQFTASAWGTSSSGYGRHGASRSKRSLLGWLFKGGSPDEDIVQHVEVLRERSRDLYMGGGLAAGALKVKVKNVIGPGLRLDANIDGDVLGLTPEEKDDWERRAEREFSLWADSPHCDAARTNNFGQLQALAALSAWMSGDVFALLPIVRRRGSIYDLRVQLLEADRICNPWDVPDGWWHPGLTSIGHRSICGGVEIGQYSEPVAYYVAQYHPGSDQAMVLANAWKRVLAFGPQTGRRNILHVFSQERPEQRRGLPSLAPVLESMKQLGRYSDAELMAAVISAMLTVFVTSPGDVQGPLESNILDDEKISPSNDLAGVELGNGAVVGLMPGQKVETVNPQRPNTAFDGFVRAICVPMGAALEIPYEILLQHFTSSYTAARASFLEFWKAVKTWRAWMASMFCQPVYEEWLAEAVARGRIAAPGFFEDLAIRAAWSGAKWHGPAQGQINEKVEAAAAYDRVQFGFSTMAQETAAMTGGNWDEVNRTRAREIAKQATSAAQSGTTDDDAGDADRQDKEEAAAARAQRIRASLAEAHTMAIQLTRE